MDNRKLGLLTWKIENMSSLKKKQLYINILNVGGTKWEVLVLPTGNNVDGLSLFLGIEDSEGLPHGWSRYAQYRFTLINQLGLETSITGVAKHEFKAEAEYRGFHSFIRLTQLLDPEKGYVVNDACLLDVEISTDKNIDLQSIKLIHMPCNVELKTKQEADPLANLTKPEEIRKNYKTVQPDQHPTAEEDIMNTFFTSLESELETLNVISSREAAKEAVAKIDEALNMAPSDFHASICKLLSPIKRAIKVLAVFDSWSSALTTEQRSQLLEMETNFKQLPERVAKAMHDKNLLIEKESLSLTLSRKLEHSVTKFKEAKAEVKQAEEKIAEAQKHKQAMLAEQKEMFKVSKKLKTELEALGKEWAVAEYEAKAKVAEQEHKSVMAEWGRMKDFIASIKRKI